MGHHGVSFQHQCHFGQAIAERVADRTVHVDFRAQTLFDQCFCTVEDKSLYPKPGLAQQNKSAHSYNATSPAVRLTVLRIPSYACTIVTVAAEFDDSADCT